MFECKEYKCETCGTNLDLSKHLITEEDNKKSKKDNDGSIGGEFSVTCSSCRNAYIFRNYSSAIYNSLSSAQDLRRTDDFAKAIKMYDSILQEEPYCVTALWGRLLSKYGVSYVANEDNKPTLSRASSKPITEDEDFLRLKESLSSEQFKEYFKKAEEIERINKRCVEISAKKDPYDVFICYKDSIDLPNGTKAPTEDRSLGYLIYNDLTNKGLKVFFSHVTLKQMAGDEYEPNIFAALNTASVMLVLASKIEYLYAPWVHNEWSRFLDLAKNTEKGLILCHINLNSNSFPEELKKIQALNNAEYDFKENLLLNIQNIIKRNSASKQNHLRKNFEIKEYKKTEILDKQEIQKRSFIAKSSDNHIEASEQILLSAAEALLNKNSKSCFKNARKKFEQILKENQSSHSAYIGLILCDAKVKNIYDFYNTESDLTDIDIINYDKAISLAPDEKTAKLFIQALFDYTIKEGRINFFAFKECLQWTNKQQTNFLSENYFIKAVDSLSSKLKAKHIQAICEVFDLSCVGIDNTEVDLYVSRNIEFADNLRISKYYKIADSYYDKAISADASASGAHLGKLLCSQKIHNIDGREFISLALTPSKFKLFEDILQYGYNSDLVQRLIQISFDETKLNRNISRAIKLFENAVACIPVSFDKYYWDKLTEYAFIFINLGKNKKALKYLNLALSGNERNDRAYLGKLLISAKCRNIKELILSRKPLIDYADFNNAMGCSEYTMSKYVDLGFKQDYLKEHKKYRKCLNQLTEKDILDSSESSFINYLDKMQNENSEIARASAVRKKDIVRNFSGGVFFLLKGAFFLILIPLAIIWGIIKAIGDEL